MENVTLRVAYVPDFTVLLLCSGSSYEYIIIIWMSRPLVCFLNAAWRCKKTVGLAVKIEAFHAASRVQNSFFNAKNMHIRMHEKSIVQVHNEPIKTRENIPMHESRLSAWFNYLFQSKNSDVVSCGNGKLFRICTLHDGIDRKFVLWWVVRVPYFQPHNFITRSCKKHIKIVA